MTVLCYLSTLVCLLPSAPLVGGAGGGARFEHARNVTFLSPSNSYSVDARLFAIAVLLASNRQAANQPLQIKDAQFIELSADGCTPTR